MKGIRIYVMNRSSIYVTGRSQGCVAAIRGVDENGDLVCEALDREDWKISGWNVHVIDQPGLYEIRNEKEAYFVLVERDEEGELVFRRADPDEALSIARKLP